MYFMIVVTKVIIKKDIVLHDYSHKKYLKNDVSYLTKHKWWLLMLNYLLSFTYVTKLILLNISTNFNKEL